MSTGFAARQVSQALGADVPQHEKIVELIAAAQLTVRQQNVKVTANTATDDWTLTLPWVSEAAGILFAIVSVIANSKAVTVADAGDDGNFVNLTLNTDDDAALLYSDGKRWWVVVNDIA